MASIPEDARAALEAFYKHFEALKRNAEELKSLIEQDAKGYAEKLHAQSSFAQPALAAAIWTTGSGWKGHVESLVQRYNIALAKLTHLMSELTSTLGDKLFLAVPFQLPLNSHNVSSYDLVNMVIEGCNQVLGLIDALLKPKLSYAEQMRLKDLRKEVEKLKDSKVQYHLFQAIEECEHGHHLAAALIAGKVAKYTIEQLRALFSTKSDEETAEKLAKALGVKDDDRRLLIEKYLKACKLARHFFTHDLNAIPKALDALSLIADVTKLAEWLSLVVKTKG
ncbi:MAG: hypothetical protein LM590_11800 [Thermofilum sp.]|nr:hypothetical protein [Thermofilum sp.]